MDHEEQKGVHQTVIGEGREEGILGRVNSAQGHETTQSVHGTSSFAWVEYREHRQYSDYKAQDQMLVLDNWPQHENGWTGEE